MQTALTGLPVLAGLLLGGLIAAMVYATWTDLRARIIPNPLNLGIVLAAPLWWWASGMAPWPGVAIQLALAAAALVVLMGVFALGAMGGGDVKMIAALGLWLVPLDFIRMLIWMSIGGGVLTMVMLVRHKALKIEGPIEVPYGVAIAVATVAVLTQRYLYHFA